jgi:AbrB family looped-hinge helix DNA binding protein
MLSRRAERAKPAGISRIGQRRQVVIPQVVLDELQLREGDLVEVTAQGGRVSLKPRKTADTEDLLTPAEAKKVRTGLRQLKEGKKQPWTQVKHDLGL